MGLSSLLCTWVLLLKQRQVDRTQLYMGCGAPPGPRSHVHQKTTPIVGGEETGREGDMEREREGGRKGGRKGRHRR